MTVSGMKRSMEDMQVDSDVFTSQTGISVIQSINECVRYKKYFYSRFKYACTPYKIVYDPDSDDLHII